MKNLLIASTVIALLATACVDAGPDDESDDATDEGLGEAPSPQIIPGSFQISQGASIVAYAWRGTTPAGNTEFWVKTPSYNATAARAFSHSTQSCADFRKQVCFSGLSGATYYRATFTQSALNCASPPSAITPPAGAVSFLGSGSYSSAFTTSGPFAYTYVSGNAEYWAMNSLVPTGTSSQSPYAPPFTSFSNFVSTVCALPTPPPGWFTAYYRPSTICSVNPC